MPSGDISVVQRFFSKIRLEQCGLDLGPCWTWTGNRNQKGYGMFRAEKFGSAHRFSYRTFVGPIPKGLVIDHLCRNRACVNPLHLDVVTLQENQRRGRVNQFKDATHCSHGHEFTEQNTYLWETKGRVHRSCRQCHTNRERIRREEMRLSNA